jgi:hypothetical protein
MGTLLRVLSGDVSGGYDLLKKQLIPLTDPFRWVMAAVSQCLPEPALEFEYAAVRDASAQSEIDSDLHDLFVELAAGWLEMPDGEGDPEGLLQSLKAVGSPESKAFLEAFEGKYQEALDLWTSSAEKARDNPYVAAGQRVAGLLASHPSAITEETPLIGREDLDTLLGCVNILGSYEGPGEEDFDRLADGLSNACR